MVRRSDLDYENKLWLFMDYQEEKDYYHEVLTRLYNNPRYYLDNLNELRVFRCSFINYKPEKDYIQGWSDEEIETFIKESPTSIITIEEDISSSD